jgi:hypothetical protein
MPLLFIDALGAFMGELVGVVVGALVGGSKHVVRSERSVLLGQSAGGLYESAVFKGKQTVRCMHS